jgi:sec-independent protein translocase protein TatA
MGLGGLHIWHLLIILVIVLVLFGTKRLRGLGSDLGNAIKGFRSAVSDGDAEQDKSKLEQKPEERVLNPEVMDKDRRQV